MTEDRLLSIILRLESLSCNQKYAGFDPHDVKGSKLFMKALAIPRKPFHKNLIRKIILGPLILGEIFFPYFMRKIFGIEFTINAKGISLFAKGYLNLYKLTKDDKWLVKAENLLVWLSENKAQGQAYPSWGYPFDWDSGVDVPAGTPASVVSAAAFDAFWTAWEVTQKQNYLDTCVGICKFFTESLNITNIADDTLCFSYTPLDDFQVHNANLLVAECLLKTGCKVQNEAFIELGHKAANFALVEQNSDGSLYYWSSQQDFRNAEIGRIDHYHSGFEMRCLYGAWKASGVEKYKVALDRYFEFYQKHLINRDSQGVFPNMFPGIKYPIDVHSCAEALLVGATFKNEIEQAGSLLEEVLVPILDRMITKDGWFRYMIRKFGPFEFKSNIVYMRWGQSWMFNALTFVLLNKSKPS